MAAVPLHIRLSYQLDPQRPIQAGSELGNPLFDLLHALESEGSIKSAADALGLSYRHVWGAIKQWEDTLQHELIVWRKGRRATLTPYAQRLIWAERQSRVRMTPHLEALRAELAQVLREADNPNLPFLSVAASHDLGVGHLQRLAADRGLLHMKLRFTGSEQALRDLNEGVCQLAGFHVPRLTSGSATFRSALAPHLKPGVHKLISAHRRVQGWMTRRVPGSSSAPVLSGWERLQTPGTRLINRQPGSGTRLLLDHLLAERGLAPEQIHGYHDCVEHTHVAMAALIAGGSADIGLGIEAVAHDFGLDFEPLVEEDYFLVCLKENLDSPAVVRLRQLLAQPSWLAELQQIPSYTAVRPGEVLSLVQALPWWTFRRERPASPDPRDTQLGSMGR